MEYIINKIDDEWHGRGLMSAMTKMDSTIFGRTYILHSSRKKKQEFIARALSALFGIELTRDLLFEPVDDDTYNKFMVPNKIVMDHDEMHRWREENPNT